MATQLGDQCWLGLDCWGLGYNNRVGGVCGYLAVERACLRAEQGKENAIEVFEIKQCKI